MAKNTVQIELSHADADRLRTLAARAEASADVLAGSLLHSALLNADLDSASETALIKSLPGALESIERGRQQIADGRGTVPEELR